MPFEFHFGPVLAEWPRLLDGLLLTLGLSAAGIALGTALGIGLAVVRATGPRPVAALVAGYVEVIRNTPFLIQLFIIFFGLPPLGLRLSAPEAALLALTINLGAYATEIVRAGIESVHPSQIEAGQSLAMTRLQVFRYVVLLPALARVWPALCSQFVLMMLSTSICSFISVEEMSGMAASVESQTYRSFEVYILVSAVYLALAVLLRLGLAGLGRVLFPVGSGLGRLRMGRR